jgi:hypothetical protein
MTKQQALDAYSWWLMPGNNRHQRMAVQVICSEGEASLGHPEVDPETIGDYNGGCVKDFHKYCRNQTFGKIY